MLAEALMPIKRVVLTVSFRGDASIERRCALVHRRISRFRVWSFRPSRN